VLIERVRRTLSERALLDGATGILVACSGGPDSTALLHGLWALRAEHGLPMVAASVDHGLRPEAAQDVGVAADVAQGLGVPFVALAVHVEAGASRQAQARRARYVALLDCAGQRGLSHVAVGHTRDDQAETVLARLLRGTGVGGLSAVAPKREDGVIRPLIDCARAEVHAYVRARGLAHVSDPSNVDRRYLRARIREGLLPALQAENPRIVEALCALSDDARAAAALIERDAERVLLACGVNARALREESPAARRWALRQWAEREHGIVLLRTHLEALDRMLWRGGEVRLPGDRMASLNEAGDITVGLAKKRGRGSQRPRG
jgi:tRNA(Ile)-lysidine synthase